MNKVLSSMVVVAIAGATSVAFAQTGMRSSETTVERSTTVQVPKADVTVDENRSTTTTTTTPAARAKSTTTTTTSERKGDGDGKVEVKSRTKTETER